MNDVYTDLYRQSNEQPVLHVDDGGNKRWRLNNVFHREHGPAIEYTDGDKVWFMHGKCHREHGPAIEYANGHKQWYLHGARHRTNGPAIERPNGEVYWYVDDDVYYDVSEWAKAALQYENKPITQDDVDDKVMQVMQADMFK